MNCRLTPASQRAPFHVTTINLAGMLLCVFTTLTVLVSVSGDQSGATLSDVTNSFNGSLQDHGRKDIAIITAAFRQEALAREEVRPDNTRSAVNSRRSSKRNVESSAASEDEETGRFSSEMLRPTDVNGPVFSHLMTELQRYCDVSPPIELGGQLALDLHSQVPQSENFVRNSIERILKTAWKANQAHPSPAEFEIIVWASTPATQALAAASEEAFALEKSLRKSLKTQPDAAITISSSGRIWTRTHSTRPLATVVIRAAKH